MASNASSSKIVHSSSSITTTPTPNQSFMYDVFVSFRGSDTRESITRTLVRRLKDLGVEAFFDECDLEKGEKIEELLVAIKKSNIFILIISEHYGDSKWCLKEMTEIVDTGRKFIPVFYKVNPKDVKDQTGNFGDAFRNGDGAERCGRSMSELIKAMKEIGSRSGYVLDNDDRRNEEEIRKLVEQVGRIVKKAPFSIPEHIVGLDEKVLSIKDLIFKNNENNVLEAQFIGIHGIGGIGKTTLALAVYNSICHNFSYSTFVQNVREGVEKKGMCSMQKKLLRGLVNDDGTNINSEESGKSILKQRLSKRRVLIVLDDVDNIKQLKALVGERAWFDKGSKILVTTRDETILDQHQIVDKFHTRELKDNESLQLLSRHAFGMPKPTSDDFAALAKEVLKFAAGLPLAIEVYGCLLRDRKEEDWVRFLRVVEGVPSQNIYKRLEISLHDLHRKERDLCLDIAAFFIGYDHKNVAEMWRDDTEIDGLLTINKLTKRGLLKVDDDGKLRMHDLVRDMARNVIKEDAESSQFCVPKRIWDSDTLNKVLQQKKGLERIEGIKLDVEKTFPKKKPAPDQRLDSMHNLRILQIDDGSSMKESTLRLPQNLEWLEWEYCPIKRIPSHWDLSNIVYLDLSKSKLEEWAPKMVVKVFNFI